MERAQVAQLKVTDGASAAHAQILEAFVNILSLQSAVRKSCVTDPSVASVTASSVYGILDLYFVQFWSLACIGTASVPLSSLHLTVGRAFRLGPQH